MSPQTARALNQGYYFSITAFLAMVVFGEWASWMHRPRTSDLVMTIAWSTILLFITLRAVNYLLFPAARQRDDATLIYKAEIQQIGRHWPYVPLMLALLSLLIDLVYFVQSSPACQILLIVLTNLCCLGATFSAKGLFRVHREKKVSVLGGQP